MGHDTDQREAASGGPTTRAVEVEHWFGSQC